jgi:hypothetical protein
MRYFLLLFIVFVSGCELKLKKSKEEKVFCNPINLSYRYQLESPSRREAADPSIVRFKGGYYLFLSKMGGYYQSTDFLNWKLISSTNLPIEEYAPTALALEDTLFFMTKNQKIYKTEDPQTGIWEIANDSLPIRAFDPMLFLDDDGRLYLYHGLSARMPIKGVELDRNTLQPIGEEKELLYSKKSIYGWERPGDYNYGTSRRPWVEGAFVSKHNGKYYLQYSVPGTQFKSYADGMYVSDKPLGEYTLADHNPFSYKPEGFIAGAGHGSLFHDKYGNNWYAGTMSVSVINRLERRIGLFPAFLDEDGCLYAYTGFGDYPHNKPTFQMNGYMDYKPSYMLLSYNKPVDVSTTLKGYPKEYAVNEDIRTSWSAQTGNKGEWLVVDLEGTKKVCGIQVNFADVQTKWLGRSDSIYHQYLIEYSINKNEWKKLVDKTKNKKDLPHNYIDLEKAVKANYIRITNQRNLDSKFAISGLRIFGFGLGEKPDLPRFFSAKRDSLDGCKVYLDWSKTYTADGYNIRYGIAPDKLYLNYKVFAEDKLTIRSLNSLKDYYFTIDAFNESGINWGKEIIKSPSNKRQNNNKMIAK